VNQTAFFKMLGAPLNNTRWSWGAVREGDGTVFLKVWKDQIKILDGVQFAQLTYNARLGADRANFRHRERLEHVARVKANAPCYLIYCEAVDPTVRPRRVRWFNSTEVFPGDRIAEFDGDWWVEMRSGVPVQQVIPSPSGSTA
jgi:hypothetical protein